MFVDNLELTPPELDKLLENDREKITALYFGATWCGPCKTYTPLLKRQFELNENIQILKLDVEENIDLVREYDIKTVPTIVFFKHEKESVRLCGLKTLESLTSAIDLIK